jgi:hypothetical protein
VAELDAVGLVVRPAAHCAFENAAAFEFRGNAEDLKDNLGKVGRDARVAVNRGFIVHQESASEKANSINGIPAVRPGGGVTSS